MASLINTGTFSKDLVPGVKMWFGAEYNSAPAQYLEVYKDSKSSGMAYEEAVAYVGLDLLQQKPEGTSISFDAPQQLYTSRILHNAYAGGVIATHEAAMDSQGLHIVEKRSQMLARALMQTKNVIGANILNRGFSSSYTGGDGSALFSTTHATVGGSVSNKLAVDADLDEASLEQALIDIRAMNDNRGLRALHNATKLVVPRTQEFRAARLLMGDERPGTAERDINAVKKLNKLPGGTVVLDYLTDDDAWFLLTDAPDGLVHYEREAPFFKEGADDDSLNSKVMMYTRFSMGWHEWRGAFGSQGA